MGYIGAETGVVLGASLDGDGWVRGKAVEDVVGGGTCDFVAGKEEEPRLGKDRCLECRVKALFVDL